MTDQNIEAAQGPHNTGTTTGKTRAIGKLLPSHTFLPQPNFVPSDITTDGGLEVVIGINNLVGIAWLSRGITLAAPVARVRVKDSTDETGTGFLVGNDLLITNHHVLPDEATALASTVEFNYQLSWSGQLEPTKVFAISKFEKSNETLDYTLVRIANSPGDIFGFIDPTDHASVAVNDFCVIIQHPEGGPKQIALADNKVSAVFGNVLQYTTDTEPGSSGSPIFNTHWQIVGLHHAGGNLTGPDGKTTSFTNEGIQFSVLVNDADSLLGVADPIYTLTMGDIRSDLIKFLELGVDIGGVPSAATSMLASHPALADAITARLNSKPTSEQGSVAIAASGVAGGVATMQWLRTSSGGTSMSAAKVPPGPSATLSNITNTVLSTKITNVDVYSGMVAGVESQVGSIANLTATTPANPNINDATVVFLTAASAGAQAVAP